MSIATHLRLHMLVFGELSQPGRASGELRHWARPRNVGLTNTGITDITALTTLYEVILQRDDHCQ